MSGPRLVFVHYIKKTTIGNWNDSCRIFDHHIFHVARVGSKVSNRLQLFVLFKICGKISTRWYLRVSPYVRRSQFCKILLYGDEVFEYGELNIGEFFFE